MRFLERSVDQPDLARAHARGTYSHLSHNGVFFLNELQFRRDALNKPRRRRDPLERRDGLPGWGRGSDTSGPSPRRQRIPLISGVALASLGSQSASTVGLRSRPL
jgi:hypothetical protein